MELKGIQSILEDEGITTRGLFCTVHAVRADKILVMYSSHPNPEPPGDWQHIGAGVVGMAVSEQEIQYVPNVRDQRLSKGYIAIYPKVQSELAIPVLKKGNILGVVNFESDSVAYFDGKIAMFERLTDKISDFFYLGDPTTRQEVLLPETPLFTGSPGLIRATVEGISADLLRELPADPDLLHRLTSRQFEHLVAELLDRMGYTVILTPAQKDGGVDILAVANYPTGRVLTLVECKRYSSEHRVPVGVVRSLLGVLSQRQATQAMIVTTSTFTKGAKQEVDKYKMSLKEYADLTSWINRYLRV